MQRYYNNVANQKGGAIAGASVTVLNYPGLSTATVYSTNSAVVGNVLTQPLTTLTDGSFFFYAPDGHYSLIVVPSGGSTSTVSDIILEDAVAGVASLLGGAAGSIPYQLSTSTTSFVALGTSSYILTAGASAPQWARPGTIGMLGQPNLVVTVGAQNCNYTTIQAALTNNPTANLLVLVNPGTYAGDTINFTANSQCVIGLGTGEQQILTSTTSTICNVAAFTTCFVRNITMTVTAATSAIPVITASTGSAEIDECYPSITNSSVTGATRPSIASITGSGTLAFDGGDFTFTDTVSDGTGVTAIKAAFLPGAGIIRGNFIELVMTGSGQSVGITTAYTASSGYAIFSRSNISITDTGAGVVVGYYSSGTALLAEIEYNDIMLVGGGSASVSGIFVTGTVTVNSHHCRFSCTGGATNYSGNIGTGCTWVSAMDEFSAASGYTGAGTINIASSPSVGNFQSTGVSIAQAFAGNYQTTSAASVVVTAANVTCTGTGTQILTLPTASTSSGRGITITNKSAVVVISTSTNVVPLIGGASAAAILVGTAGKFAELVCDGTNYQIMKAN